MRKPIIALIAGLFLIPANAQRTYRYSIGQLSDDRFHAICEDKTGFIWIGTENGLNRYDGYGFDCFKSEAGDGIDIPSDRIMDLILDKNGNLLCLIDDHVFLFDTNSCKYHNVPQKQEQELVKMFAKILQIFEKPKPLLNILRTHNVSIYF